MKTYGAIRRVPRRADISDQQPQQTSVMPLYRYSGKKPHFLAQVGEIKEGDVFPVTLAQAASLDKNDPENFRLVEQEETPALQSGNAVVEQPLANKKK